MNSVVCCRGGGHGDVVWLESSSPRLAGAPHLYVMFVVPSLFPSQVVCPACPEVIDDWGDY